MTHKRPLLLAAVPLSVLAAASAPVARASTPGPDVGVIVSATPDPVALFGTLTYTISVTNHDASQTATGVAVTDTLIDDPTLQVAALVPSFGSVISSASGGCTISAPPSQPPQVPPATIDYTTPWTATCTFGNLAPGATAVATVAVTVQRTNTAGVYAPNPVVNTAQVSSTSGDANPTDDVAVAATCISFPSQPLVCAPGT